MFISGVKFGYRDDRTKFDNFMQSMGFTKFKKSISKGPLMNIAISITQNLSNYVADLKKIKAFPTTQFFRSIGGKTVGGDRRPSAGE